MFKLQYYKNLNPRPVWPMQSHRVDAIYGTMARTIRKGNAKHKQNLKQCLLDIAHVFETNCRQITASQASYDEWFYDHVMTVQAVEFDWEDAKGIKRNGITFGLTQKFLNLVIKDWWCMSQVANDLDCSVLHAPFDNVVSRQITVLVGKCFSSLKAGGYYVHLSRSDYDNYQQYLLDKQLQQILKLPSQITRIETEQKLFGLALHRKPDSVT